MDDESPVFDCHHDDTTVVEILNPTVPPPPTNPTEEECHDDSIETDPQQQQPVNDDHEFRGTSWDDAEFSVAACDFTTLSPTMIVPYVDAKTKAMGLRAELEELRKRNLTKKERSRVLKRLSLSDQQADPVSTQEMSEFFLQQRERDRAWRQQHRDSIEFLHHYRGNDASQNAGHPAFAKENICSKNSDLKTSAYSSMSEINEFSQHQWELAREMKQQKQFALENIRKFRNNDTSQVMRRKSAPTMLRTSFNLDERESQGISVLPRIEHHSSKDGKSSEEEEEEEEEEGEQRDVSEVVVPSSRSSRQSFDEKLDYLIRSPYNNISPYARDSSDSSTTSSATRKLAALGASPFSDGSTASRKLAIIGSVDMDRSEAHIFEDGDESLEDFDAIFRSGKKNDFVVVRHSSSLSGISLPELHAESDMMCLDCSPEAALLIIRAERLDSLETSTELLNDSNDGTEEECDRSLQPDASQVMEIITNSPSKSPLIGRTSHIVPPSVPSYKRDNNGEECEGEPEKLIDLSAALSAAMKERSEDFLPSSPRNRVSGIVPPSRRSSRQSSDMSFLESEDESETDVLSASEDDDSDTLLKKPNYRTASTGKGQEKRSLNQLQVAPSPNKRKSNLVFPLARSSKYDAISKMNKHTERKPLTKLIDLRTIFRRSTPSPPSPKLKEVPLYSRRPLENKREVLAVCEQQFIPILHKTRAGCERCLHWASQDEREKFEQTGHHFRIMMTRGGCNRNCAVFPREPDEYPVRLCRKCFFDTHQFGQFYTV